MVPTSNPWRHNPSKSDNSTISERNRIKSENFTFSEFMKTARKPQGSELRSGSRESIHDSDSTPLDITNLISSNHVIQRTVKTQANETINTQTVEAIDANEPQAIDATETQTIDATETQNKKTKKTKKLTNLQTDALFDITEIATPITSTPKNAVMEVTDKQLTIDDLTVPDPVSDNVANTDVNEIEQTKFPAIDEKISWADMPVESAQYPKCRTLPSLICL